MTDDQRLPCDYSPKEWDALGPFGRATVWARTQHRLGKSLRRCEEPGIRRALKDMFHAAKVAAATEIDAARAAAGLPDADLAGHARDSIQKIEQACAEENELVRRWLEANP